MQRLKLVHLKTVGIKQTLKAVDKGQASLVYIAKDAERRILEPVLAACAWREIPVVEVESMRILGKACGIEVGCACASILKDQT